MKIGQHLAYMGKHLKRHSSMSANLQNLICLALSIFFLLVRKNPILRWSLEKTLIKIKDVDYYMQRQLRTVFDRTFHFQYHEPCTWFRPCRSQHGAIQLLVRSMVQVPFLLPHKNLPRGKIQHALQE